MCFIYQIMYSSYICYCKVYTGLCLNVSVICLCYVSVMSLLHVSVVCLIYICLCLLPVSSEQLHSLRYVLGFSEHTRETALQQDKIPGGGEGMLEGHKRVKSVEGGITKIYSNELLKNKVHVDIISSRTSFNDSKCLNFWNIQMV